MTSDTIAAASPASGVRRVGIFCFMYEWAHV